MKKQFLNLGKALSKAEQKSINGGMVQWKCRSNTACRGYCVDGKCVPIVIPRNG